jgi:hypothetical protein
MAEGKADADVKKTPPDPVKGNEIIGRRLEKNHVVVSEAQVKYLFQAFYDSRITTDLSVDLIGDIGNAKLTRKRPSEVAPIAIKDFADSGAESPFAGWAGITRKTINTLRVNRTPVTIEEKPENPNPYHCEIDRSEHRTKAAARSLAYELVAHAEQENMFVAVPNAG